MKVGPEVSDIVSETESKSEFRENWKRRAMGAKGIKTCKKGRTVKM